MNNKMTDLQYDNLLKINTIGKTIINDDYLHYCNYIPTPYSYLEKLFEKHPLKEEDTLIDFGSGKGRLIIYSNYLFSNSCIGIEFNKHIFQCAKQNIMIIKNIIALMET
ncbi:hypothetical protein [Natronospora cellulosivora (SeqCode)]